MAAGPTYEPLATTTLGSATSIVTFSTISGSYTDLVLIGNTGVMSETTAFRFRFNSDDGSNYSYLQMSGNGSSAASTKDTSQVSGLISGALADASNPNMFIMNIQNYSNTTTYKTTINRGSRGAGSLASVSACVSLWRSTSAITSISLSANFDGGVNFPTGSTFTLYGILAA